MPVTVLVSALDKQLVIKHLRVAINVIKHLCLVQENCIDSVQRCRRYEDVVVQVVHSRIVVTTVELEVHSNYDFVIVAVRQIEP